MTGFLARRPVKYAAKAASLTRKQHGLEPDAMKPLQTRCMHCSEHISCSNTRACEGMHTPGLQAVVYPLQALPGVGHVHCDDCTRPAGFRHSLCLHMAWLHQHNQPPAPYLGCSQHAMNSSDDAQGKCGHGDLCGMPASRTVMRGILRADQPPLRVMLVNAQAIRYLQRPDPAQQGCFCSVTMLGRAVCSCTLRKTGLSCPHCTTTGADHNNVLRHEHGPPLDHRISP